MLDDAASDANRTALEALGQLWLAGVSLDWRWVDAARMLGSQRIALPGPLYTAALGRGRTACHVLHESSNNLLSAQQNPILLQW